jgi:FAD synthase
MKNLFFFMSILANLDEATVEKLPSTINHGVYYGWAQIKNQNEIYKMVTSIGTNPFYNGEKKTIVCEEEKTKRFVFFRLNVYLGNTSNA